MVGWQTFSPTLLVEVEGSLLKRWVALYALVNVWRRGEMEKYTCTLASPRLAELSGVGRGMAWCGLARRWMWAHDVRMNSPAKSSPKPHRSATSFYCLFLLQVHV
jgi:hypothetical protein